MTPTPEQLHVFRMVEEANVSYGVMASEDDMTASEIRTARQLSDLGYLTEDNGEFQVTDDGQLAFVDCGR